MNAGRDTATERDFESIRIGDRAEIIHEISQADIDAFAALSGDYNPLHVDEIYAETTTFKRPVAHGMLSGAFISTMVGMHLPGKGALWSSQTLEFLRPVYVGDVLRIQAVVDQISMSTRTLVLSTRVLNQHDNEVVTGIGRVKVLESRKAKEMTMADRNGSRVVLVTGGTGGIGEAIVRNLAQAGNRVCINFYRAQSKAESIVNELRGAGCEVAAFGADVADEAAVAKMFSSIENAYGAVQAVVHCAAPTPIPAPLESMAWPLFQAQIDTQVRGAFNIVKSATPGMLESGQGRIILLGSIYADGVPPTQQSPYVVAKAALSAFARTLAVEYGPKGIRVNIVSPGMTQTEMNSNIPEKTKLLAKMQAPLRRLAEPGDIAGVVAFLLSPAANHITGETIRVCGGTAML